MIPRSLKITIGLLLVAAVALGLYVLRLKRRAEQVQLTDTRPVAAPVAGPTEQATLVIAYDDDAMLKPRTVNIALPREPQLRAQQLMRSLISVYLGKPSPHQLGSGSDVKDVYILTDGTAVVDMNSAFVDGHRSGIFVEDLTMLSMVQTLAANDDEIKRVKFLVEGKDRETLAGHADLRTFYDVATTREAMKQLQ